MQIKTIVNANVYLAGTNNLIGQIEKAELPTISVKREDMGGLGAAFSPKITSGFEPVPFKLTWKAFYPDALKDRLNPFKAAELQIRCSLETHGAGGRQEEQPVVINVTGIFSKTALGALEGKKPISGMDDEIEVERMTMTVDGAEKLKLDIWANIYEVDGVDLLATMKSNIGS